MTEHERKKEMKLHTKVLLVLLAGLAPVYFCSWLAQWHLTTSALERFSRESRAGDEARQWQWVEGLQHGADASLVGAMAKGEMDKVAAILQAQRTVPGLQEYSLHDGKGRVAYSSDPACLKKDLPAELKPSLLASPQTVKRRSDDSFELYQPLRAEKACIECHTDWKQDQICGVMSLRFSVAGVKATSEAWAGFESGFKRLNLTTTTATAITLMIVAGLVVVLVLRYQVAAPLKRMGAVLFEHSDRVAESAAFTGSASQSLAEGASEQAASIEQTSASLEELSSMT
jgi:hypothetical protein